MQRIKLLTLLFVLIMPLIFFNLPVSADEGNVAVAEDGVYRLRIESSQWEFKVFDINVANERGFDLETESGRDAAVEAGLEMKHRVALEEKGAKLEMLIYSRDVQHGFSINELNIAVALNRPEPGNEFGAASIADTTLPNEDITYSAFCHIFCGLGHPDMKVKFVIGAGSVEYGPFIFIGAIAINIGIFGMTVRSIVTKINMIEEEPVPAK